MAARNLQCHFLFPTGWSAYFFKAFAQIYVCRSDGGSIVTAVRREFGEEMARLGGKFGSVFTMDGKYVLRDSHGLDTEAAGCRAKEGGEGD